MSELGRDGFRIEVEGRNEQHDFEVDLTRWIALAEHALDSEGVRTEGELTLLFVDEQGMTELNEAHMGSTGPTDVLAFPIDDDPLHRGRTPDSGTAGPSRDRDVVFDLPVMLGDVVVCPTVAARQAPENGSSVDDEIALLVVHGVLHLLGHDHMEDEEAAVMQTRERAILDSFT